MSRNGWREKSVKQMMETASSVLSHRRDAIIFAWIILSMLLIYCLAAYSRKPDAPASRKAQQAKINKETFQAIEKKNRSVRGAKSVEVRIPIKHVKNWRRDYQLTGSKAE